MQRRDRAVAAPKFIPLVLCGLLFWCDGLRSTLGLQPKWVKVLNRIVSDKAGKIQPALLSNWVPADPPPRAGVVITAPVVKEIRLVILVFSREPEGVGLGHWPSCPDDLREGA